VGGVISFLLATTGRPSMAQRCVQGIRDTTRGHDIEIIAAVDNDPDTRGLLGRHVDRLLYSGEYRGCSQAWNDALVASTGDLLVLAADDLVWHPGWLDAALATMNEFPEGWGLVGFNDGHMGAELSTHYLMSRRLVRDVFGGRVAWDCYRHSFNDVEANERAKRAGRYAWCEAAHVTHEHWLFGQRAQDPTDQRSLPQHPDSQRAYEQRAAAGFPDDMEAVIT
jgi:GT2 family glycosyltransferase